MEGLITEGAFKESFVHKGRVFPHVVRREYIILCLKQFIRLLGLWPCACCLVADNTHKEYIFKMVRCTSPYNATAVQQ